MSEFRFEYNGVVEWNLEIFDEMEKKITAIVREIFTLNHPTRLDLTQTVNDCFFVLRINKESNGIGFLFLHLQAVNGKQRLNVHSSLTRKIRANLMRKIVENRACRPVDSK